MNYLKFAVQPSDVVRALLDANNGNYIIAGGAARAALTNEQPNDYDLWVPYKSNLLLARGRLEKMGCKLLNSTEDGTLVNYTLDTKDFAANSHVQLIYTSEATSPESLIDSFDFTICRFAITRETREDKLVYVMTTDAEAIRDAFARHLVIANPTAIVSTLARVGKYIKQGFEPGKGFYTDLYKRIRGWPENGRLTIHRSGESIQSQKKAG